MKCQETKAIMERRLYSRDLNHHHTYYGGKMASDLDTTCSIAAEKFCHTKTMTASINRLDYIHPAYEGDMIHIEAFVTGSGTRSFEVMATITATNLEHTTPYLVARTFMTFVVLDKTLHVPTIEPETAFEKQWCAHYDERQSLNKRYRQLMTEDMENER